MSKITLRLLTDAIRERAIQFIRNAPVGWIVTLGEPPRTNVQNKIFHAIMTDIVNQWTNLNHKYEVEIFKRLIAVAFAKEIGLPVQMIPSLDGMEYTAYVSTRDFSVAQGRDFIEYLHAFGAERGVVFNK